MEITYAKMETLSSLEAPRASNGPKGYVLVVGREVGYLHYKTKVPITKRAIVIIRM